MRRGGKLRAARRGDRSHPSSVYRPCDEPHASPLASSLAAIRPSEPGLYPLATAPGPCLGEGTASVDGASALAAVCGPRGGSGANPTLVGVRLRPERAEGSSVPDPSSAGDSSSLSEGAP